MLAAGSVHKSDNPELTSLCADHSKHDFAHNNPIMTKIKSGHAKHRKVSGATVLRCSHNEVSPSVHLGYY